MCRRLNVEYIKCNSMYDEANKLYKKMNLSCGPRCEEGCDCDDTIRDLRCIYKPHKYDITQQELNQIILYDIFMNIQNANKVYHKILGDIFDYQEYISLRLIYIKEYLGLMDTFDLNFLYTEDE